MMQSAEAIKSAKKKLPLVEGFDTERELKAIEQEFHGDKIQWAKKWNDVGFQALDKILARTKGKHAVGDQITLADVFLVPQFRNAVERFGVEPGLYPNVVEVVGRVKDILEFVKAFPENQVDFK